MTVLVYLYNRATGEPGYAVATFPNARTIEEAEREAYMKYNDGTTEVVYVRECSPDAE